MQVINKKIIVIFICVSIISFSLFKLFNKKEIELDSVILDTQKYDNTFAIYVEQNGGNYEVKDLIPEEGYVLNEEKSQCMNIDGNIIDDILNYDYENNKVIVDTSESINCYLYFDKGRTYILMGQENIIKNPDTTLTNMLGEEGNFETEADFNSGYCDSHCTTCEVDSTLYKYGTHSCKISNRSNVWEQYINTKNAYKIDNTHIYYARVSYYVKLIEEVNQPVASIDFYWPYLTEPRFKATSFPIQKFEQWDVVGVIDNRASFENESFPFRIDFNYDIDSDGYESNSLEMIFDGAMLIDLTESYGSNYPKEEYLNKLIYFDNSVEIKEIFAKYGIFELNSNVSKIECNNNATTEIENLKVTIKSNEDYTVCMIKE